MNLYVVVGFVVAFGVTGAYAMWTILETRKVAAQVMALNSALNVAMEDRHDGSAS
jgi:hypothetical protein